VTAEMALKLAAAFRTTPEFWLNAQKAVDLHRAVPPSRASAQAPASSRLSPQNGGRGPMPASRLTHRFGRKHQTSAEPSNKCII
jgi:hypothetical protein